MPKQVQLTAEQKAAIDNYGSEIHTLKDFVTAVRRKPGMYIGGIGAHAFINCQREIYSNSMDQILSKDSPANWFSYYYNENTYEVRVEDNGKSLPFDRIIDILTKNHTSKNFEKKPFDFSTGNHGSGSKITNALSTVYIVEAYHYDGTAVRVEFEKGYPKYKNPKKIPNKEHKQGLMTYFIPDTDVLGDDLYVPWKTMYRKIKQMLSLAPIGSVCDFTAVDKSGKVIKEHIINTDGIVSDLINKCSAPINKPIIITDNTDGIHKLDVAFCYDAGGEQGPSNNEDVSSFANFSPTRGGTHVDGTLEGICRWFSQYMNNIYLAGQKSKDKLKVTYTDIKTGLCICISAAHLDPVLVGQSKELLDNNDMVPYCKEVVMKGLDEWSKANPADLQKLCKFFKEMAELRTRQEAGKIKIVSKYQKNPLKNLPQKYIRPTGDKNIELILVEGDSALGTVRLARDKVTQGLMPLRGKLANAFSFSKEKFFNNEEVQAITQIIFGQEYRKGLTVEDAKVSKIIFMCDRLMLCH
jgi:DNA gyrase/topoisomerase IV subunit B